ncbi:protease complex subunit PrcB family protein [Dokdonia sp.]|uniref:protease complex subunit PrcB family protein n=1 Tax=Dokdonia sp. TaxID=2024995 RepID=UPI003265CBD0
MKKGILLILVSILVLSCNSDDDSSEVVVIESTLIAKSILSGAGDEGIVQQNSVITDQNTWNNLITQMNTVNNVSDSFSEIDIDFSEFTVIAVFDEVKATGGYSLELDIMSNSVNIIVNITHVVPTGGGVTTALTQPYYIVKIPVTDLPIIFE